MAWPKGQPRKAVAADSSAAAPLQAPAEKVAGPLMVEALRVGYYGKKIREPGAQFEVRSAAELGRWMRVL